MENSSTRKPKQARSLLKKEMILDTALKLYCKQGFYRTTTNQIAKEAGVGIGSLYEYYHNKEDILLDILDRYFTEFLDNQGQLTGYFSTLANSEDKHKWLKDLLTLTIESHKSSKEFNKELHVLYLSIPQVADICNKQKAIMHNTIFMCLLNIKNLLIVTDIEAASYVFADMIESMCDRVVLYNSLEENRIIAEGVEALHRYLFG